MRETALLLDGSSPHLQTVLLADLQRIAQEAARKVLDSVQRISVPRDDGVQLRELLGRGGEAAQSGPAFGLASDLKQQLHEQKDIRAAARCSPARRL